MRLQRRHASPRRRLAPVDRRDARRTRRRARWWSSIQCLPQEKPSAMELRFRCSRRHAQHLGNFLVFVAFHVVQHEHSPRTWRQLVRSLARGRADRRAATAFQPFRMCCSTTTESTPPFSSSDSSNRDCLRPSLFRALSTTLTVMRCSHVPNELSPRNRCSFSHARTKTSCVNSSARSRSATMRAQSENTRLTCCTVEALERFAVPRSGKSYVGIAVVLRGCRCFDDCHCRHGSWGLHPGTG